MTTLRDIFAKAETGDVIEIVQRIYEPDAEWLPEAIADVLDELRRLTPDESGGKYELHIEPTVPLEPDDQPFWEVWCSKQHDPERYGLDLSPWEEWLAIEVPQSLQDAMSNAEIAAHCIWDMTFYGFTQERIAETHAELDRRVKEINEGKVELIPWEEVKARLGAKFRFEGG